MHQQKIYNYLTIARQKVLDAALPLTDEQYLQPFPIGLGTLGRTLAHIMISEWFYIQRMTQRDVPPYDAWPIRDENPPPLTELITKWREQADQTQAALKAVRDWDEPLQYTVTDDEGKRIIVTCTPTDIFTQLTLHEVHHRAQALNILRHLGITLDDLDYNALMYDRREAAPVQ
jgi:uncharacterized damage-inducible protein DinB